jgi:two-component system phosphate regulon response regulator PhoB/two-component system alkaline phosphatase synthesis response regulator PhoP
MAEDKGPVLVVDDEPDIVEFLTTVLRDEGYSTESARDGLEALARLDEIRPALMILDLMMPRMTGLEVLEALRERPHNARPSIIVLSAKSTHQDILDALERGADDFIPKPFDLEDLLLRVRVWLDRMRPVASTGHGLRVFTLGPFRVFDGEELLLDEETGDPRARTLLKYLVTERGQTIPRDQVVYLLWPDLEGHNAEMHLSRLLENLRAEGPIGRHVVEEGTGLRLAADSVWVDADEFESQVRSALDSQEQGEVEVGLRLFLSALALYKEDYLRENLYEDWPSERRERLRELWISSMFRVAAICADRCEYADSVRLMKKVLEIDPYRENAYQALMLYLSRAGRRGEAIQLYRYAERLFAQHLAAQPAPSTRMLYEKILRGEAG